MTPIEPTPPKASSRPVPAGAAHHAHDEHLYDPAELHNEDVAHEHSDVNVRAIINLATGLAVITAVIFVAMWGLFRFFESQAAANEPRVSPLAQPAGQLPPEPRLLIDEPQNLQRLHDELAERLKGIEDGKKQLLEQGIPTRADAPTDHWMGTRSPTRGEASGGRGIPVKPGGK